MDSADEDDDNEFAALLSIHRQEMMTASAAESDLDLAFRLQLEEAMAASISHHPPPFAAAATAATAAAATAASTSTSTSTSNPHPAAPDPMSTLPFSFQTLELDRLHQERRDGERCQAETRRLAEELHRREHDERFAREIAQMPEDEWDEYGDEFERPIDPAPAAEARPFRLYFKGVDCMKSVKGEMVQVAAIGVAVCDPEDRPLLQIQKPVGEAWLGREALEMKALIEGINAAISLGIKRIDLFTDYRTLYNHITGRWVVKQRKVANLINQSLLLRRNLDRCQMNLLPRCHVKFAFKLAKDALDSQITKNIDTTDTTLNETCKICLEDTDSSQMFEFDGCSHRFCFSCMKQHVEVKLLHGLLPGCPYDGCKTKLDVESSKSFLSPKLLEIMMQRVKEASIPVTEKVYCPYPKCSALMSISEAIHPQQNSSKQPGLRKCTKCNGSFCIYCKVPWHDQMSCYNFKRLNPHHRAEEAKLQSLAKQNLWRQCVKCKHMIELAEGCFHMTCRCGHEFCYTCGAEWRDKKATCSCPLWNEGNIWYDDSEDEYSDDSYDDADEDEYDYDDDDYPLRYAR